MIVSISKSVMALARVWLVVVCVSVLASLAAPFGLNKDHEKAMEELKQQLRKLKDLPGVDQEEYLRYWKEAVKDDPSEFVFVCVSTLVVPFYSCHTWP